MVQGSRPNDLGTVLRQNSMILESAPAACPLIVHQSFDYKNLRMSQHPEIQQFQEAAMTSKLEAEPVIEQPMGKARSETIAQLSDSR